MRIFSVITFALLCATSLPAQKIGQKIKNQLFLKALTQECPDCVDKKGRLTQKAAEIDSLYLDLATIGLRDWDLTDYQNLTAIHFKAFGKLKTLKFRHYEPINIGSWPPNLEKLDLRDADLYEPLLLLPPKLKTLICSKPSSMNKSHIFDKKRFFDYPLPQGLEYVEAEGLFMKELPSQLPASVKELRLANNNIESIDSLPAGLEYLNLDHNPIKNFTTDWPASLRTLSLRRNDTLPFPTDWGNCRVERIDLSEARHYATTEAPLKYHLRLPPSLKELILKNGYIPELSGELPQGLERLELRNSKLEKIPALPSSLKYLNVSLNKLRSLPELPQGLETLIFPNNPIQNSPVIPPTLREIDDQFYKK